MLIEIYGEWILEQGMRTHGIDKIGEAGLMDGGVAIKLIGGYSGSGFIQ